MSRLSGCLPNMATLRHSTAWVTCMSLARVWRGTMLRLRCGTPRQPGQGHAGAQYNLQRLAEHDDPEAQFYLGLMYEFGDGVLKDDAEAVKWYHRAAEQGHNSAIYKLGFRYMYGEGVLKDDVEAVKWFRKAAEHGYDLAQHELGVMYAEGRGVPQNDVQAYAWFNVAAAQGFSTAREARNDVANRMLRGELARAQSLAQQYWEVYVLPYQI